ncbi:Pole, partial [Symbiodinium microadriaticum]
MKEFNALSEFADPSLSYVMLDIICSYCNICRDMDLLRDPVLTGKNRMQGDEGGRAPLSGWFCTNCGNGYDVAGVEQRLLEDVERIVTTFLLQDFRCSKTLAVSTRLCSSTS